ncbi:MAG: hypothetical protein K0U78_12820 [Actinomycetia bacterium]|nr:hypothetical protein [Actinomycetes bacterium]
MGSDNEKTITLTLSELKALERLAVQEAKVEILVTDFQRHREYSEKTLTEIFTLLRDVPKTITDCRDTLEKDIDDTYMSKTEGKLMEEHFSGYVRSIKIWMVSTVGGFSAAGIAVMWFFNIGISG